MRRFFVSKTVYLSSKSMSKSAAIPSQLLGPAIPIVVALMAFVVLRYLRLGDDSALIATAVTIDLTMLSPILYFLLIRKTSIPNITVVPVFILSLLLAGQLVPQEHQQALAWIKQWFLPFFELGVIGVIGYHFVSIRKTLKEERSHGLDFYEALKIATSKVLPKKIGHFLAVELATFYYGFLHWKKPPAHGYTYHKTGGTIAILVFIMLLIPIETVVLHLLIRLWNDTVAWVVTIISIYTAIQLFGMIRSIKPRPIDILADQLVLRFGMLAEANIPLKDIESVEKVAEHASLEGVLKVSPIASFEGCNVLIRCGKEQVVHGLYGMKRKGKVIAFRVDEAEDFVKDLERRRSSAPVA